jgi:beta-lactamase class A
MSPWIEWFVSFLRIAFQMLTVLSRIAIPMRTSMCHCANSSSLLLVKATTVQKKTLLRIIGGPAIVQSYVRSLGITAFQLIDSEHDLDRHESLQYRDWIEPAAAVQLLQRLVQNPPISPAANAFLVQTLTASVTGPNRLRAGLPPSTPLAHKTGSSGTHGGITAATNDMGLITLPDGRKLAVAVLVTDSRANEATREGVIARIARAAYDEAITTK